MSVALIVGLNRASAKRLVSLQAKRLVDDLVRSAEIRERSPVRVAIFKQKDAYENVDDDPTVAIRQILATGSGISSALVSAGEIRANRLEQFDVVVFPGGNALRQAQSLGDEGRVVVRRFVRQGGGYVGLCAGAFLATARSESSLALLNATTLAGQIDIPGVGIRSIADRGGGIVEMELKESGKAVFGTSERSLSVHFGSGPIFNVGDRLDLPPYVILALFHTEIAQFEPQRGSMVGTPAIIAGKYGKGRVIAISPHPDITASLEFMIRRAILATARDRESVIAKASGDSAYRRSSEAN